MALGRHAPGPARIPVKGWIIILKRVLRRQKSAHIGLLAAGMAFYGMLSLFPGITAAVALTGLVLDPEILSEHAQSYAQLLPENAREIVMGQLGDVVSADQTTLGFTAMLSILLSLYSASRAVASLIAGLNVVYEERETRNFLLLVAMNIGLTVGLLGGLLIIIAVVAALPGIAALFQGSFLTDVIMFLRWPALFLVASAGMAVLYKLGPDRRSAKWRWLTPGAALACGLWVVGSFGFDVYVRSFASYNETFGTLGGVIVLLTWMWLSSYIVLLGALLDAEAEAQTAQDSTVGPDLPLGERGAVKADSVSGKLTKGADDATPPLADGGTRTTATPN